jgi:hypothetical protein
MAGATQARRPVAAAAAPARAQTRRRERCPECGAFSERRQLVCLGCGERLALEQKQQAGRPVIAAAAALALVSLVSFVFIAQALIGGGDGESRQPAAAAARTPAAAPSPPSGPDAVQRTAQRRARDQLAAAASAWPAAKTGWTVVLLGTGDRDSAENYAQSLEDAGVDAGVISPTERPDLGTLWLVFSGAHPDQAGALTDAAKLRAHYPGAYTRYIPTAPSGGAPAQPPPA